jgi:hypothetical protein
VFEMRSGSLEEFGRRKARLLALIHEKEAEVSKQREPWRSLNRNKLRKKKVELLGPELKIDKSDKRTHAEWARVASEARRGAKQAAEAGNYSLALKSEGYARYAEFQIGIDNGELA